MIETALSFFLAPMLTAGTVLGIVTFDGEDRHHLNAVTVTQAMADHGFTDDVANRALRARVKDLYYRIDGNHASPLLPLLEEQTSEVIAAELHIDRIVLAARRLRGLVASEFDFAFLQEADGEHALHVTEVEGDDMRLTRWRFPVAGGDYGAALTAGARRVVLEIDPTLIALDHLLKNELESAKRVLDHCRQACAYSDMATTDILDGVLALKRAELGRAAMSFKAAQLRYPDLWIATLGLAVVDARRHDFAAARAKLATPTSRFFPMSPGEARRVAALRAAEGRLLARAGFPREAANVLDSAVEIRANNYRLHIELAQTYQQLRFDGAAAYQRRRAEQLRSGVYGSIDVVHAMLLDQMG